MCSLWLNNEFLQWVNNRLYGRVVKMMDSELRGVGKARVWFLVEADSEERLILQEIFWGRKDEGNISEYWSFLRSGDKAINYKVTAIIFFF